MNPLDFWGTGRDSHRDHHRLRPGAARGSRRRRARVLGRPHVRGLPGDGVHRDGERDLPRDRASPSRCSRTSRAASTGPTRSCSTATGSRCSRARSRVSRRSSTCSRTGTSARARPSTGASPVADEVRERWRDRLASGEPFDELEGLALLADYGVPVVESVRADTLEDAIAAAERLGFPVAVKTAAPGVQHKSDVGGVRLGVDDSPSLEDAYDGSRTAARAAGHCGADGAAGRRDRARDRARSAVRAAGARRRRRRPGRGAEGPAPRDAAARRGCERAPWSIDWRCVRCSTGSGASRAADVDALAKAIVALSWLAHDLGDHLEALDANPVDLRPEWLRRRRRARDPAPPVASGFSVRQGFGQQLRGGVPSGPMPGESSGLDEWREHAGELEATGVYRWHRPHLGLVLVVATAAGPSNGAADPIERRTTEQRADEDMGRSARLEESQRRILPVSDPARKPRPDDTPPADD